MKTSKKKNKVRFVFAGVPVTSWLFLSHPRIIAQKKQLASTVQSKTRTAGCILLTKNLLFTCKPVAVLRRKIYHLIAQIPALWQDCVIKCHDKLYMELCAIVSIWQLLQLGEEQGYSNWIDPNSFEVLQIANYHGLISLFSRCYGNLRKLGQFMQLFGEKEMFKTNVLQVKHHYFHYLNRCDC